MDEENRPERAKCHKKCDRMTSQRFAVDNL